MNIVKKTVFPESIFSNLEKKDGLIAILFFICFFLLEFLLLYIIKSSLNKLSNTLIIFISHRFSYWFG